MWKIHGKYYNLENFLDRHPGGKLLLNQCKNIDDATAAFESYHALCNMEKIQSIMKKYEIKNKNYEPEFSFNNNDFYYTLKIKVQHYFKYNCISHHSDNYWLLKSILQTSLYMGSFLIACYNHSFLLWQRILLIFFSGHMFVECGFCIMHDASHHAISYNKHTNELLSSIWHGLALWDNSLWYKHHSIMHHSFTGTKKDPDTIHFKPFIRKSTHENSSYYYDFNWILTLLSLFVFPGMWLGQSLVYTRASIYKYFWRIDVIDYKVSFMELLLKFFTIFSLFYSCNLYIIYSYIFSVNLFYSICILPDHDTLETHKNIVYNSKNTDWGELQVRNSGNFSTKNNIINIIFGGINYQIEHHLFPTICHIHYPEISKIIIKTCQEYNIPYVNYDNMFKAVLSTLYNFKNISKQD